MYFVWWHGGGPRLCRCDVSCDCMSVSRVLSSFSSYGLEKDKLLEHEEYMATLGLQDQDLDASNFVQLRKALMQYFRPSSFVREHTKNKPEEHVSSSLVHGSQMDSNMIKFYDKNPRAQHESYVSALWKLRDRVLSLHKQMPHKHYCAGFV
ncbi:hypothetical protein JHK87_012293 [Glycine soja]|nr:hypothetical protein JHK87_012293 [Glycine soja]